MPADMAYLQLHLFLVVVIASVALFQPVQAPDPLADFCRRFAHQTTIIDRKLYIDGGLVNYSPFPVDPTNYTNQWLLYADLDVTNDRFPVEHANITKGVNVPSLQGGTLFSDSVNKVIYLYGGEYPSGDPDPFSLWAYDVLLDQWNRTTPDVSQSQISRVSFGAGAVADEKALAYYYGGWLSNASVPGWGDEPLATSYLLVYDMIENNWQNNTGPDNIPRAEGVMLYLPASDMGMLVYFGGVQTPNAGNGSWSGVPMSEIRLYDIANDRWYTQTASGDVPEMRRRFCAGVTWAADYSSYNIYLYGGLSMPPNTVGFDDVYILTLPSFTWMKWYPSSNDTGNPHHSLSCNIINGAQIIVMGGTFPNSSSCDVPQIFGMHNLNLGKNNKENAMWYPYDPSITTYQVPTEIIDVVGGGITGGATVTSPTQGWGSPDLSVYFTRVYAESTRTATRYIPATGTAKNTSVATHTSSPSYTNVGAIAGGTVGGVLALAAAILIACVCLRRRSKKKKQQGQHGPSELDHNPTPTPMGELSSSSPSKGWAQSEHSASPELATRRPVGSDGYSSHGIVPQRSPVLESTSLASRGFYDQHTQQQHSPGSWTSPSQLYQQSTSDHLQPYYPPPPEALPVYPTPPIARGEMSPQSNIELPVIRSPMNVYDQEIASGNGSPLSHTSRR